MVNFCKHVFLLAFILSCSSVYSSKCFTVWPRDEAGRPLAIGISVSVDYSQLEDYATVLSAVSRACKGNLPKRKGCEWEVLCLTDMDNNSFLDRHEEFVQFIQGNPFITCSVESNPIPPPHPTVGQRFFAYLWSMLPGK